LRSANAIQLPVTDTFHLPAGDYATIPPGNLFCIEVHEPTFVVYCRWLTPLGGIESLYSTQTLFKERQRNAAIRYLMPLNARLGDAWGEFIEFICNEILRGMNHPFSLIPGVKVSAWGLNDPLPHPQGHGMKPKYIFALASLAQSCMDKNALMIGDVPQRNWGRLTNWCKANLGSSSTQKERESKRGGRPDPGHDTETEGEVGE
jgi:hypothetical protein